MQQPEPSQRELPPETRAGRLCRSPADASVTAQGFTLQNTSLADDAAQEQGLTVLIQPKTAGQLHAYILFGMQQYKWFRLSSRFGQAG
jgi:hypothetical protein